MSSTESSGTPAEGSATSPAPSAEFPTFGTTRGSGLARGKRPSAGPAAASAAATPSDYKPTAIEVVSAPREYTNPFAPATPEPTEQPAAELPPAIETPKAETSSAPAPVARFEEAPAAPAELNILPPAEQKTAPAQTWESDGFSPTREPRRERPRREEEQPAADEPVDIASIPPQFLYVRPGVTYVPTPRNWGGAPRERRPDRAPEAAPRREERDELSRLSETSTASAPAKSGGFIGWLKSLFGGASSEPVTAGATEPRREGGGERRHRGGRNRGGRGGEGGGQRRHRGHRGGRGGPRSGGEEGSRQGGI